MNIAFRGGSALPSKAVYGSADLERRRRYTFSIIDRKPFGSDKVRNLHLTVAFAHLAANCLLYIPNFAILILVNDIHGIITTQASL